jgi:hypothetical protein
VTTRLWRRTSGESTERVREHGRRDKLCPELAHERLSHGHSPWSRFVSGFTDIYRPSTGIFNPIESTTVRQTDFMATFVSLSCTWRLGEEYSMSRMRLFATMLLCGVLCLASMAAAQTETATVSGRVSDSSGAVGPGANVELQKRRASWRSKNQRC